MRSSIDDLDFEGDPVTVTNVSRLLGHERSPRGGQSPSKVTIERDTAKTTHYERSSRHPLASDMEMMIWSLKTIAASDTSDHIVGYGPFSTSRHDGPFPVSVKARCFLLYDEVCQATQHICDDIRIRPLEHWILAVCNAKYRHELEGFIVPL